MLGDPTDATVRLRPLEPASGQALARDLALKTRRRKGLGDQIAVSKYLDDEFVVRDLHLAFFEILADVIHIVGTNELRTCRSFRMIR